MTTDLVNHLLITCNINNRQNTFNLQIIKTLNTGCRASFHSRSSILVDVASYMLILGKFQDNFIYSLQKHFLPFLLINIIKYYCYILLRCSLYTYVYCISAFTLFTTVLFIGHFSLMETWRVV